MDAVFPYHRLLEGSLLAEGGYDGRVSEAGAAPAGMPAFLAPEVVRCRRGSVTYSAAGELYAIPPACSLCIALSNLLRGGAP